MHADLLRISLFSCCLFHVIDAHVGQKKDGGEVTLYRGRVERYESIVIAPQPVPSRANLSIDVLINGESIKTFTTCCANMLAPGTAVVPGVDHLIDVDPRCRPCMLTEPS